MATIFIEANSSTDFLCSETRKTTILYDCNVSLTKDSESHSSKISILYFLFFVSFNQTTRKNISRIVDKNYTLSAKYTFFIEN